MSDLRFKQLTEEQYQALTNKQPGYFYKTESNLYLGNNQLNNSILGVKGESDTEYSVGLVNITKSSIGLGNVDNKSVADIRKEVTKADVGLGNVDNKSLSEIQASLTKSMVGLGNVDNKSSATIRSELTKSDVVTALGNYDPTAGKGILTIQKNGTSLGTFNADSADNKTINVTVPTKVSELTQDVAYLKSNTGITFTQATTRANIATGENIVTILGKAQKYFADLKNVAFSGDYNDLSNRPQATGTAKRVGFSYINYNSSNKNEALNLLNNPVSLTGTGIVSYSIIFVDTVGDSPLGGGSTCIYGYKYDEGSNYGAQIGIKFGSGTGSSEFRFRSQNNGTWSNWYPVIHQGNRNNLNIPIKTEIPFASQKYEFNKLGWHRIASVSSYGQAWDTMVNIKRNYSNNNNEIHKLTLIGYGETVGAIKSLYDMSSTNNHLITKVRLVKSGAFNSNQLIYFDVYYNSNNNNGITFLFSDNINSSTINSAWKTLSDSVVAETISGQTVLSTYTLDANSWLGGGL